MIENSRGTSFERYGDEHDVALHELADRIDELGGKAFLRKSNELEAAKAQINKTSRTIFPTSSTMKTALGLSPLMSWRPFCNDVNLDGQHNE